MPQISLGRRALLGTGLGAGLAGITAPVSRAAPAHTSQAPNIAPGVPGREFGLTPDPTRDQTGLFTRVMKEASERGLPLLLEPGIYRIERVVSDRPTGIIGVRGETILRFMGPGAGLSVRDASWVTLSGLVIEGDEAQGRDGNTGLIDLASVSSVAIADFHLRNTPANALSLRKCGGIIRDCEIEGAGAAGLFSIDATGLEIASNHIHDCADNAILVWRSAIGEDGTLVTSNRIERIRTESGGSGQNGNGVNVYRAGNVMVSGNRIADCAFSAIRSNAGSNCQMLGNNCSRIGEVALYAEFGFQGALIANNVVEQAQNGVSITNFNDDGRLAVCSGNIIRNMVSGVGNKRLTGISVEADTVVSGNVVEQGAEVGISMGWGTYLRNCIATSNIVRDCAIGFAVQIVDGAGKAVIAGNIIAKTPRGAIIGMDYATPATGDLAKASDARAGNVEVTGNTVT